MGRPRIGPPPLRRRGKGGGLGLYIGARRDSLVAVRPRGGTGRGGVDRAILSLAGKRGTLGNVARRPRKMPLFYPPVDRY